MKKSFRALAAFFSSAAILVVLWIFTPILPNLFIPVNKLLVALPATPIIPGP